MKTLTQTPLGEIMATRAGTVDPTQYPTETFDLYSIPAFDKGEPDVALGQEIGSTKQVVRPGDVLLSKIVPHIRRSWVVGKDRGRRLIASSEWIVFRSDRFHSHYLRHILTSDQFHVQFMGTVAGVGGSLLRARPAQVASLSIPLPPFSEQRRIADILDKADAIRRKRQDAISLTETIRESAFHEIVGCTRTNKNNWPVKTISEIATVQGGIALSGRRDALPLRANYLRVANVFREKLDLTEIKKVGVTESEYDKSLLLAGDVLVVEGHGNRDELGRAAIWDGSIEGCLHQNHLIRVRPDLEQVNSPFLCAFINSSEGRSQLFALGKTTSGLNTINISNVRQTRIIVPPPHVQLKLQDVIRASITFANRQKQHAEIAEDLFNSLVQRAFRGEL